MVRLFLQAFGRRCGLLHQCSILLGHAIHFHDGLIDLGYPITLLHRRDGNLAHDFRHAAHAAHHFIHGATRFIDQPAAGGHLVHRIIDQFLDLLGRCCAALRQITHFGSHHGKATPLLTGPRRLHRRVQRQNIGLESDAIDHADDVDNLIGRGINRRHGRHHLRHHRTAALRHFGGSFRQLIGLAGIFRIVLDGARQFVNRCRRLFQCAGLVLGASRQIGITLRNFGTAARHIFGTGTDLYQHIMDLADKLVETITNHGQLIIAMHFQLHAQIGIAAGQRRHALTQYT